VTYAAIPVVHSLTSNDEPNACLLAVEQTLYAKLGYLQVRRARLERNPLTARFAQPAVDEDLQAIVNHLELVERALGVQHVTHVSPEAHYARFLIGRLEARGYDVYLSEFPERPLERRWEATALLYREHPAGVYTGPTPYAAVTRLASDVGLQLDARAAKGKHG
jgi:hypothetical protein